MSADPQGGAELSFHPDLIRNLWAPRICPLGPGGSPFGKNVRMLKSIVV